MKATKRDLIGRTIVDVDFRPARDGRGGFFDDPVLILDNGTRIGFLTQETDVGEYGTRICRLPSQGQATQIDPPTS